MKTVHDIVQEYLNRQNKPEYIEISTIGDDGQKLSYENVTNLKIVEDEDGKWIEFDCSSVVRKRHVKMKGAIVRYVQDIWYGVEEIK